MDTPDATRINRFLAAPGVASRRAADTMVEAGRVRIDGVVAETGSQVRPGQKVTLDGNPVYAERKVYLLLNKPGGVVTTANDPEGRPTVLDHVKVKQRVFPVGRLDSGTTGLLLMTNDGALAERLMHPRYGVEKIYHALVKGLVPEEVAAQLAAGVELDDGPTQPATREDRRPRRRRQRARVHPQGGPQPADPAHVRRGRLPRARAASHGLRPAAPGRYGARSLPQPHAVRALGPAAARWSRRR